MSIDTNFRLTRDQESAVLLYANKAQELLLNQFSLRSQLEEIDRYYMREGDFTEANIRNRNASRAGDKKKIQDITVPIVMPQVEAALGYMANVFLTGQPIFGVAADPKLEDAALQMQTIVDENATTAGWKRQFIMFFRDGLKYNLHGLECDWEQRNVASIDTDIKFPNSAKPVTTVWKGNVIRRMDLYNTFFDPRVHPSEIHSEGEFAGYTTLMSRVRMKKFINDCYGKVPYITAMRAFESQIGGGGAAGSITPFNYYVPMINPAPLMLQSGTQSFDWMAWAQAGLGGKDGIRYTNVYAVTKIYGRLIPADFGLKVPEENTPQIWKFFIVNGQVVLWAERCSNAHGYIPIFFGQPLEDGLDFQTKSFATNVQDMQDVASAFWNGYLASKRRLVGDRVLYDPLRVREKDINSTNPAAKIPVRPSAYGKNVSEAVYQFPYRDEATNSLLQGASEVVKMANIINNMNPAQQGQFVKGNKTQHEYEDVMGHGNSHNQVIGITTEEQVFTPLKLTVKLNILQYQPAGDIYSVTEQKQVAIKPEELRNKAVHFKVSDGMIPQDKQMSTEEWNMAMQAVTSNPQIGGAYTVGPMFTYLMKMRGADLTPFEKPQEQQQYEQALQAWQNAAALLAKNANYGDLKPEQMQQILGPMPQPPKPVGTPQPAASESAPAVAATATPGGQ